MIKRIKGALRRAFKKCFGYDLSVIRTKVGEDFRDQKRLLSDARVRVIFDVGANIGQTTMKYKKLFPRATIFGFEPFLEAFRRYCEVFVGDAKVSPQNVALSDRIGTADFFVNDHHYTNSLLPINEHNGTETLTFKKMGKTQVRTETLDAACERLAIDKIDVLKLDVQGGELLVLRGAERMLREKRVALIYTEVEFSPLYEGQPLYGDIERYLAQFGYAPFKTYNVDKSPAGNDVSGDAIFISTHN